MECLFCKIAQGAIPAKKVYEDKDTIAFLDINPANPGHTLIVPKKHAENIMDADDKSLESAITVVKKIARLVTEKTGAEGVNVLQNNGKRAGQIVNHVHFHVIPRFENDSMIISYPRMHANEAELDEVVLRLTKGKNSVDEAIMREMGGI